MQELKDRIIELNFEFFSIVAINLIKEDLFNKGRSWELVETIIKKMFYYCEV